MAAKTRGFSRTLHKEGLQVGRRAPPGHISPCACAVCVLLSYSLLAVVADAGEGKKKRERKRKDPNAPKKPLSAYLLFCKVSPRGKQGVEP